MQLKKGDWVYYLCEKKETKNLYQLMYEKGKIKSIQDNYAFVVFNCNDDWNNYEKYTASKCDINRLKTEENYVLPVYKHLLNNENNIRSEIEKKFKTCISLFHFDTNLWDTYLYAFEFDEIPYTTTPTLTLSTIDITKNVFNVNNTEKYQKIFNYLVNLDKTLIRKNKIKKLRKLIYESN